MIKKTVSLSNQPPLSERDLGERALDWLDALEGTIPEDRIRDAFARALKNHSSSYPINAFDMLAAWKDIEAEETAAAETLRIAEESKPENRVANCREKKYHVGEGGYQKICNPFNFNEEIVLPCRICRPTAYDEAHAKFIRDHGEIKPLEILNNFVSLSEYKNRDK